MTQQRSGRLKTILEDILKTNASEEGIKWLIEKAQLPGTLSATYAAIPRKTGRKPIHTTGSQQKAMAGEVPALHIEGWTTDRLARVWFLMTLDASDREKYIAAIESLFRSAEVNELVALYSALPVLEYPESWAARCAEGIRSNIGDVLTAIMCNNPYPSQYLEEAAWNQLVLKAFFTERPIDQIIGLDKRTNEKLASTLYDYAHERLSAHRAVDPQLWRCIAPFIDEKTIPDYYQIKEYVLQS